jgi:DNA-binding MarR family transcriptional regulator
MSELDVVLRALPRVVSACRRRHVADSRTGKPVSAHRVSVLTHLDVEDPTMVGELAEHLGVTPSTMSLTLKRLEEAGYVRRDRDPADRRVANVRLTDAGARIRDAQGLLDPGRVAEMLSTLSPGERASALRGVKLLAEAAERLGRRARATLEAQVGLQQTLPGRHRRA